MALKVLSPWMTLYHEIQAFFATDIGVHVVYEDDKINLYVEGDGYKAAALDILLKHEYTFGDKVISVNVIPANSTEVINSKNQLRKSNKINQDVIFYALGGNDCYDYSRTISGIMSNPITYVVFKNKVVQYYVDNLFDIYGQRSTLYETIAKEIFSDELKGIFYCTEKSHTGDTASYWP